MKRILSLFGVLLSGASLAILAQNPTIVSTAPAQNMLNVPKDTVISVTFDSDMNASTINSNTFIVQASQTGLHSGIYSYDRGSRLYERPYCN